MSKFLLVSIRHGAEVLAAEYRDFLVSSGLRPTELDQVVLDSETARIGDVSQYAGVFLGGSPFNVTDAQPTAEQLWVQQEALTMVDADIPAFYACFGSSLLTHFRGGVVGDRYSETAGSSVVELTQEGTMDPLLQGVPSRFNALTGHAESVEELATGAKLLATGPTCPVQMFRINDTTWATQFHPELDAQGLATRMQEYLHNGYFAPEEYDEIVAHISSVDVAPVRQIMRNFVSYATIFSDPTLRMPAAQRS